MSSLLRETLNILHVNPNVICCQLAHKWEINSKYQVQTEKSNVPLNSTVSSHSKVNLTTKGEILI